jgi:hypothetical protein
VSGRFRLYADANIHGPLIDGLVRLGWDLVLLCPEQRSARIGGARKDPLG